jgi:hypothetical protein
MVLFPRKTQPWKFFVAPGASPEPWPSSVRGLSVFLIYVPTGLETSLNSARLLRRERSLLQRQSPARRKTFHVLKRENHAPEIPLDLLTQRGPSPVLRCGTMQRSRQAQESVREHTPWLHRYGGRLLR